MTLKPWREVIIPMKTCSTATFREAAFAADLTKVVQGLRRRNTATRCASLNAPSSPRA